MTQIRTKNIKEAIQNMRKTVGGKSLPVSTSAKEKAKALCNNLFKYAIQEQICTINYTSFVKLKKEHKVKKNPFKEADINKLFENDALPGADMLLMLIYMGCRISEFLNIRKNNVNIEKRFIIGGLKTEAGRDRILPIHNKIFTYLKKYYDSAEENDFLFKHNGKRMTADHFRQRLMYPLLDTLEIERRTPHDARRTLATLLSKSDADKEAIKKILGHSKYSFTVDEYVLLDSDDLLIQINKI